MVKVTVMTTLNYVYILNAAVIAEPKLLFGNIKHSVSLFPLPPVWCLRPLAEISPQLAQTDPQT